MYIQTNRVYQRDNIHWVQVALVENPGNTIELFYFRPIVPSECG